jgi:DnaJ-class molecular chaperone
MSINIPQKPCPVCLGKGYLFSNRFRFKPLCHNCRGTGRLVTQTMIAARIYNEQHRNDVLSVKRILSEWIPLDGAEL